MNRIQAVLAVYCLALFSLSGCHADTSQGGGTETGHPGRPAAVHTQPAVPTPPTADQVDPSSPRAVLDGTSTTQTQMQPHPALRPRDARRAQPH